MTRTMETKPEIDADPQGRLEALVSYKVAAIGWHCFSAHCKYNERSGDQYYCGSPQGDGGLCLQNYCPVFKNAKAV